MRYAGRYSDNTHDGKRDLFCKCCVLHSILQEVKGYPARSTDARSDYLTCIYLSRDRESEMSHDIQSIPQFGLTEISQSSKPHTKSVRLKGSLFIQVLGELKCFHKYSCCQLGELDKEQKEKREEQMDVYGCLGYAYAVCI